MMSSTPSNPGTNAERADARQPIIAVEGLRKRYPNAAQPALDSITLAVQRGALAVVLGRSGSGKTTLFRCLNGLVQPDSGQITLNGQPLAGLGRGALRRARRRVATIFQQYNLIQRLTVLENVLAARLAEVGFWRAALHQFSRADVQWALYCLDRVGMADYAGRRADSLSGGQQQRAAIARAMAQKPDIILADEPIASLDPESATQVMDELRMVCQDAAITVLCSLHQEAFALDYGTHIIGLYCGKVVVDVPRAAFSVQERQLIYQNDSKPTDARQTDTSRVFRA